MRASRNSGNRRNGKISKTVQSQYVEVNVETPRERDGSLDPQTVHKRETILAEGMADRIIGMYAFGTGSREIGSYFEREFNTRLSAETISARYAKSRKNKGVFPSDTALGKLVYPAYRNIREKWTVPLSN